MTRGKAARKSPRWSLSNIVTLALELALAVARQIEMAVSVEICGDDPASVSVKPQRTRETERAVAIIEQDRDRAASAGSS